MLPWPLVTVLDKLLERSGYRQFVRDGSFEGEERWANVVELRGLAAEQGDLPSAESLPVFLEQVALAGEVDQMDESPSALTLITLHQVKGLEFPVVFITGVEEGLLPHSRSLDTLAEIEEERRLLYVGMTRAKRAPVPESLLPSARVWKPAPAIPSRFLAALGGQAEVENWNAGPSPTWDQEDRPVGQGRRFVAPVAVRGNRCPCGEPGMPS